MGIKARIQPHMEQRTIPQTSKTFLPYLKLVFHIAVAREIYMHSFEETTHLSEINPDITNPKNCPILLMVPTMASFHKL